MLRNGLISVALVDDGAGHFYWTDVIEKGTWEGLAIELPTTWTAANLSFLGAMTKDGNYGPIIGDDGVEITVTVPNPLTNYTKITLNNLLIPLLPFRWLKIRSGLAASQVDQASAKTINIITVN